MATYDRDTVIQIQEEAYNRGREEAADRIAQLEAENAEAREVIEHLDRANNGILWLGNNLHKYGGNDFLNFMRSAIVYSQTAHNNARAFLAKKAGNHE